MKKTICFLFFFSFLGALEPDLLYEKIWYNESRSSYEKLVWWNEGEEFPSLGIGHFIWFPSGVNPPYTETFPSLIEYLAGKGITPPVSIVLSGNCPWKNREEWLLRLHSPEMEQLRAFLYRTREEQAEFIVLRFEKTCETILAALPKDLQESVLKKLERLKQEPNGLFAMIDYTHFKGEGTNEKERYQGQGWGLLQVLSEMDDTSGRALDPFIISAKNVLKRRVANAPSNRGEERWLKGWLQRVDSYSR